MNLPIAVTDPDVAHDRLPDDVAIVALTPVSNLAMGEYPASIAALDDQGDLEFVAERSTAVARQRWRRCATATP